MLQEKINQLKKENEEKEVMIAQFKADIRANNLKIRRLETLGKKVDAIMDDKSELEPLEDVIEEQA